MVHVAPPPVELKPLIVLAGTLHGIDHEGQPRRSTNPIDRLETLGTVMCYSNHGDIQVPVSLGDCDRLFTLQAPSQTPPHDNALAASIKNRSTNRFRKTQSRACKCICDRKASPINLIPSAFDTSTRTGAPFCPNPMCRNAGHRGGLPMRLQVEPRWAAVGPPPDPRLRTQSIQSIAPRGPSALDAFACLSDRSMYPCAIAGPRIGHPS